MGNVDDAHDHVRDARECLAKVKALEVSEAEMEDLREADERLYNMEQNLAKRSNYGVSNP